MNLLDGGKKQKDELNDEVDVAWILGKDRSLKHLGLIDRGGYAEVHKVSGIW